MMRWGELARIGFAGDWHGNIAWAGRAIPAMRRAGVDTLLHVGDFGIWPGNSSFLDAVEYWAALAGITVYVTPGNHDDYSQIIPLLEGSGGAPAHLTEHIIVLPRGYRWQASGRTLLSFGGAGSIDQHLRTSGRDWWPEEEPKENEVADTIAGGSVDILVTHEVGRACSSQISQAREDMDQTVPASVVDACERSMMRVDQVAKSVAPKVHVHGHWHLADETVLPDGRRVFSLAKEFQAKNLAVLDTEDLAWAWLTDRKLTW